MSKGLNDGDGASLGKFRFYKKNVTIYMAYAQGLLTEAVESFTSVVR